MEHLVCQDQDYILVNFIVQTRELIYKARQKELKEYGISPKHSAALFVIHVVGSKSTPSELSRWLLKEPHTVSTLIERMRKLGLVRKEKDLNRKNLVRVVLTEKGEAAYSRSTSREAYHRILSCLSEEEHRIMRTCLAKIRASALKELGVTRNLRFPLL